MFLTGRLSGKVVRDTAAGRIRALGHVDRLRIVEVLSRESANVGEIATRLGLSPTVTSRHLHLPRGPSALDELRGGPALLRRLPDRQHRGRH